MKWEPVTEQDKITLEKIKANPFYATCFKLLSREDPWYIEGGVVDHAHNFGAFGIYVNDFRKLKVKNWRDITQNFNAFVKIMKRAIREFKTTDAETLFAVAVLRIGTVRKLKYNHKLTMSQEAEIEHFYKKVLPNFRRVYGKFSRKE